MEEPMWTALPGTDPMPPPARPGPGPAIEEPMWTAFPSIDAGAGVGSPNLFPRLGSPSASTKHLGGPPMTSSSTGRGGRGGPAAVTSPWSPPSTMGRTESSRGMSRPPSERMLNHSMVPTPSSERILHSGPSGPSGEGGGPGLVPQLASPNSTARLGRGGSGRSEAHLHRQQADARSASNSTSQRPVYQRGELMEAVRAAISPTGSPNIRGRSPRHEIREIEKPDNTEALKLAEQRRQAAEDEVAESRRQVKIKDLEVSLQRKRIEAQEAKLAQMEEAVTGLKAELKWQKTQDAEALQLQKAQDTAALKRQKDEDLVSLQRLKAESLARFEALEQERDGAVHAFGAQVAAKEAALQRSLSGLAARDAQLAAKDRELAAKDAELVAKEAERQSHLTARQQDQREANLLLNAEIQRLQAELTARDQLVERLDLVVQRITTELAEKEQALQHSLSQQTLAAAAQAKDAAAANSLSSSRRLLPEGVLDEVAEEAMSHAVAGGLSASVPALSVTSPEARSRQLRHQRAAHVRSLLPPTGRLASLGPMPATFRSACPGKEGQQFRILCYGDDVTGGQCAGGHVWEPYGRSLCSALAAAGISSDVSVCAQHGYTAEQMVATASCSNVRDRAGASSDGMRCALKTLHPDLTLLLAGMCDLSVGIAPEATLRQIERLSLLSHNLGVPTVVLAPPLPPVWQGTAQGMARQWLAQLLATWTSENRCVAIFVDLACLVPPNTRGFWEPDGARLAAAGSAAIGQRLASLLMGLLPGVTAAQAALSMAWVAEVNALAPSADAHAMLAASLPIGTSFLVPHGYMSKPASPLLERSASAPVTAPPSACPSPPETFRPTLGPMPARDCPISPQEPISPRDLPESPAAMEKMSPRRGGSPRRESPRKEPEMSRPRPEETNIDLSSVVPDLNDPGLDSQRTDASQVTNAGSMVMKKGRLSQLSQGLPERVEERPATDLAAEAAANLAMEASQVWQAAGTRIGELEEEARRAAAAHAADLQRVEDEAAGAMETLCAEAEKARSEKEGQVQALSAEVEEARRQREVQAGLGRAQAEDLASQLELAGQLKEDAEGRAEAAERMVRDMQALLDEERRAIRDMMQ